MDDIFCSDDGMIGMPDVQVDFFDGQQSALDNCAVNAEASLIRQFGYDLSETEASYISAEHGWYMPGAGTSPNDVGNIMGLYDIETHTVTDATVADLADELAHGHGVIVGVKADDLWDQGPLQEICNFIYDAVGLDNSVTRPADHAIVVTGIDISDANNPMVLINDSGVPDGGAHAYPLDRFMDAWENSDFQYTATDSVLPSLAAQVDTPSWGDMCSDFLSAAIGVVAGVANFFDSGDLEDALETGVTVASGTSVILDALMNDDDFVRCI